MGGRRPGAVACARRPSGVVRSQYVVSPGECIGFARAKGYKTLTLWTNDILVSARRIYEAAGFKLAEEERHHSFGKDLVGQTWNLEL